MDVRHLPLEHPGTYTDIRHLLIEAVLPGLEPVVAPALAGLPPLPPASPPDEKGRKTAEPARTAAKAARTLALAHKMGEHQRALAAAALEGLAPRQNRLEDAAGHRAGSQRDQADTRWDLVLWLLDGLLVRDFPNKTVTPAERAGAPFYLYRLAQKLAEHNAWQTNRAAKSLQDVLYELSAEHTRERLQVCYGMGGDNSVNHITKVLRPVDRHQNGALHLLDNAEALPEAAALVVGAPYRHEEFRIRQALKRWSIGVPWLMNWTAHLHPIHRSLQGHQLTKAAASEDAQAQERAAALSDEALLAPLSRNKDVYLSSTEATERKLAQVLNQLAALHLVSRQSDGRVDIGAQMDRLQPDALDVSIDDSADASASSAEDATEANHGIDPGSSELHAVLQALDEVHDPLLRVALLLRIHKRIPVKAERQALGEALVQQWDEPGLFEQGLFKRLGVKPGIAVLTEKLLARAAGELPAVFCARVDEALRRFDAQSQAAARADEPAAALLKRVQAVQPPLVQVGTALRLLEQMTPNSARQRQAALLLTAWNDERAFDGGLFGYLGLLPDLAELTDEVLAWAADLALDDYRAQVDQAVRQLTENPAASAQAPADRKE